jgi:hypothetical protein
MLEMIYHMAEGLKSAGNVSSNGQELTFSPSSIWLCSCQSLNLSADAVAGVAA